MHRNNSGKTLTIFLVIMLIISVCLASIALYYYQNESVLRKSAEASLTKLKTVEAKLQGDLMESRKQFSLLEEKNKEMDEKINDLSESLDLEKSLKEAQKKENQDLREVLENENQSKEKMRTEMSKELTSAQEKVVALEAQLTSAQGRVKELESQNQGLEDKVKQTKSEPQTKIEEPTSVVPVAPAVITETEPPISKESVIPPEEKTKEVAKENSKEVELEPIVVSSSETPSGRVLSVDKENNFLILNLGEKDGVQPGFLMSIYRGNDYLGDVKVSRVQPEMSAADFIPPFSSQKVRKDDQVVAKK